VGIVDADALPTSERPSPAAPSTFTAPALVVRFCFEACLTRSMVAPPSALAKTLDQCALGETGAQAVVRRFSALPTNFVVEAPAVKPTLMRLNLRGGLMVLLIWINAGKGFDPCRLLARQRPGGTSAATAAIPGMSGRGARAPKTI
jgi:hypothetical protein